MPLRPLPTTRGLTMTTSNFFGLAPFSEHVTAPTSADIEYVDPAGKLGAIKDRSDIARVIDLMRQHRGIEDTPAVRKRIAEIADLKGWHDALPVDFCTVADCPSHATAESLREAKLRRVFR